jgi:hypothetical protein
MFAAAGDRFVIRGPLLDQPMRDGLILEVRHPDGSPTCLVRWEYTGREALVFPGPDAVVQHFSHDAEAGASS